MQADVRVDQDAVRFKDTDILICPHDCVRARQHFGVIHHSCQALANPLPRFRPSRPSRQPTGDIGKANARVLLCEDLAHRRPNARGDLYAAAHICVHAPWITIAGDHRADVELASSVLQDDTRDSKGATRVEQSQHTTLGLQSTDSLIRSREPSQAPARQPDDPPLVTCFHSDVGWDEMQVGLRQYLASDLRGQFLERHRITCSSAPRPA